jgi:hypothetical protein
MASARIKTVLARPKADARPVFATLRYPDLFQDLKKQELV